MTSTAKRNIRALLFLVVLLGVVAFYDVIMAIEVGFLSIWVILLFWQLATRHQEPDNRPPRGLSPVFGVFVIAVLGLFFFHLFEVVVGSLGITANVNMQTHAKFRNIAIAMHNYANDFKYLPPVANLSVDNKPLLSWRVHLLPYLEEEELYKKFHLDEPWDSPHNLALLPLMPNCYRMPNYGRAAPVGYTYFQLFVGPGAVFEMGMKRTLGMVTVGDGLSSTVIASLASTPVPWTQPVDISVQKDIPIVLSRAVARYPCAIYGSFFFRNEEPREANRIPFLFADGSVRTVVKQVPIEQLWPFITWQGGEKKDGNALFD